MGLLAILPPGAFSGKHGLYDETPVQGRREFGFVEFLPMSQDLQSLVPPKLISCFGVDDTIAATSSRILSHET